MDHYYYHRLPITLRARFGEGGAAMFERLFAELDRLYCGPIYGICARDAQSAVGALLARYQRADFFAAQERDFILDLLGRRPPSVSSHVRPVALTDQVAEQLCARETKRLEPREDEMSTWESTAWRFDLFITTKCNNAVRDGRADSQEAVLQPVLGAGEEKTCRAFIDYFRTKMAAYFRRLENAYQGLGGSSNVANVVAMPRPPAARSGPPSRV